MRVEGGRKESRGARGAAASAGDLRARGMEKRMREAEAICKEQNDPTTGQSGRHRARKSTAHPSVPGGAREDLTWRRDCHTQGSGQVPTQLCPRFTNL